MSCHNHYAASNAVYLVKSCLKIFSFNMQLNVRKRITNICAKTVCSASLSLLCVTEIKTAKMDLMNKIVKVSLVFNKKVIILLQSVQIVICQEL